jgi:putative nucleotidyltransferase with HDIG domain
MDYIGEPISQLQHALQCATFARDSGADDEVIIGALLHDIGHICDLDAQKMGNVGVEKHETLGGNYLRNLGFSSRVVRLVEGHVLAKRYLTYKNPTYYQRLSEASRETLRYQVTCL